MVDAFKDIGQALSRTNLWARLAVTDMQQTYKRSLLGIAWIAFAFGLFVAVKLLIFGTFAPGEPGEFAMWLTFGLWLFFFLQHVIMDGSNIFVISRNWLLATDLPLTGFILQSIMRLLIKFSYQTPIIIFIVFYANWTFSLQTAWALPGFLVILFNAVWVQIMLGIICTRFRDAAHLVQSIMSVMFFLTPILYFPDQIGSRAKYLDWNPLTHYIAIVRDPIVYGTIPMKSWIIVGVMTVVGWVISLILLQIYRKRVVFWV